MSIINVPISTPAVISVTQPDEATISVGVASTIVINSLGWVTSFNTRVGAVIPTTSDYDANQIDFDPIPSWLTATNVQDAIDEVQGNIPVWWVISFKGRSWAVVPNSSDYNASQIDYNNTTSWLTASDVQWAIDEIELRTPTSSEKDALTWTSWTPSSTNKFVTNEDDRINLIVRSVTATTTEVAGDDVIECDPSLGNIVVNLLPLAWGSRILTIKHINSKNSNSITINPDWAETIDWQVDYQICTENESVQIASSPTGWIVITSTHNEGQVKINTWNSLKPSLVFVWGTVWTFLDIQYASPLWLSSSPTTTRPRNIPLAERNEDNLYDFINNTFLENQVPWQINKLRVIMSFSGKSAWLLTWAILRLENTLSGFISEDIRSIPSEITAWSITFELTTIADATSLPSPYGTGQWYELKLYADDPITFVVESITRISSKK